MLSLIQTAFTVVWLLLVGSSYAALFLFPPPPDPRFQAPIPPDLSPAYLPLLAALLILGIIRRINDRQPAVSTDGNR